MKDEYLNRETYQTLDERRDGYFYWCKKNGVFVDETKPIIDAAGFIAWLNSVSEYETPEKCPKCGNSTILRTSHRSIDDMILLTDYSITCKCGFEYKIHNSNYHRDIYLYNKKQREKYKENH